MDQIDEATARRVLEDAERKRREKMAEKRDKDRLLTKPYHFHATVWTYVERDANGNFKDAIHHEVLGLSPDSCIRKALNRAEERQTNYHLAMLTECHDQTHGTRELDD